MLHVATSHVSSLESPNKFWTRVIVGCRACGRETSAQMIHTCCALQYTRAKGPYSEQAPQTPVESVPYEAPIAQGTSRHSLGHEQSIAIRLHAVSTEWHRNSKLQSQSHIISSANARVRATSFHPLMLVCLRTDHYRRLAPHMSHCPGKEPTACCRDENREKSRGSLRTLTSAALTVSIVAEQSWTICPSSCR